MTTTEATRLELDNRVLRRALVKIRSYLRDYGGADWDNVRSFCKDALAETSNTPEAPWGTPMVDECACACHVSPYRMHNEQWPDCCDNSMLPILTVRRRRLLAEYRLADDAVNYPDFTHWLIAQVLTLRQQSKREDAK